MESLGTPQDEMIEEVASAISLLLNETKRFLVGDIGREEYDKIGFINIKINEIEDLFKYYKSKRVDKNYIDKIKNMVIKPLRVIKEETPIVEVEKILMGINKNLLFEQGYNNEQPPEVDEDDTLGAKERLINAFKAVPIDNYKLLKSIAKKHDMGDFSLSKEEKMIRIDYMKNIHNQFKTTMPGGDFQDFLEENYIADFNELWDSKYEVLEKKEIIAAQTSERENLKHLRESFRIRALKAFIK